MVVLFHRIGEACRDDPIGVAAARFRGFCDLAARYFTPVTVTELARRLEAGESVAGLMAITFDDGYLDNYTEAAPVLAERRLPACFFIATGFIGSDTVPGWDRDNGVAVPWMTWDQVRDLRARGFEIGAHTVNHVNLGDEVSFRAAGAPPLPAHWNVERTPAEQAREIAESRATLERELGQTVELFSYPFGRRENLSEANRAVVRQLGFTTCIAAAGGTVPPGTSPHHMDRVAMFFWYVSPEHFLCDVMLRRT